MRRIDCPRGAPLDAAAAAQVARTVREGRLVAFPTDTRYALGADPRSADAVRRVFLAKGRPGDKPLPVLLGDERLLDGFAAAVPPAAAALARVLWPGALTLLLPARPDVPAGVRSTAGEVAVRVPAGEPCRSVLAAAGGALTGTSANRSGEGGAADPDAIAAALPAVDLLLDAGTLPPSAVSTIVRVEKGGEAHVVRDGAIAREVIERALGAPPGGPRPLQ